MAKDYKHRVQSASYLKYRRRRNRSSTIFWRWLLVISLIAAFVFFLNLIRTKVPELLAGKPETSQPPAAEADNKTRQEIAVTQLPVAPIEKPVEAAPQSPPAEPESPHFDFYTLLPQTETVVPDYEIKTRVREESLGKPKAAKYIMQAGSFRETEEAERLKAKLAQLGIEARVENAKMGTVIWHRVKIGPYNNSSSVATLKDLLQKKGIDVIVTETGQ